MTLRRAVSAVRPLDVLCLGLIVWGMLAWGTGILNEGFDHDEFEHVHVAWLIAHGRRPFYDFFECHTPFLWYPLALLQRLVGDRYAILFVLRFLTALGHLAFFAGLAKNVSLSLDRLGVRRARPADFARTFAVGLAAIAIHPAVLAYLLEFRLDAWPNALLLWATYRYRASSRDALRSSAEWGFLTAVAIACSPKLLIFAAALITLDLFKPGRFVAPTDGSPVDPRLSWTLRIRGLIGLAAGGAAAFVLILLALFAARLDPRLVYRLSVGFHARLNEHAGFGHGLARSLWQNRVLFAVVVASAAACIAQLGRRLRSHPFEMAIIVFLGVQMLLVSFPNKQYYAPWFLLGAGLVPYLELPFIRVTFLRSLFIAAALVYGVFNARASYQQHAHQARAGTEIAQREKILALVPEDGSVVASMERNPLFRRDTLYHIVSNSAPSGYGTTRIMADMNLQPFSARFSTEFYRREMEERPPDLIMSVGWLTLEQHLAIDSFLDHHRADYRAAAGPLGPMFVRRR